MGKNKIKPSTKELKAYLDNVDYWSTKFPDCENLHDNNIIYCIKKELKRRKSKKKRKEKNKFYNLLNKYQYLRENTFLNYDDVVRELYPELTNEEGIQSRDKYLEGRVFDLMSVISAMATGKEPIDDLLTAELLDRVGELNECREVKKSLAID